MSNVAVISTGYIARPLQGVLHASLQRFNVIVCHRRFGKTVLAVNELIDQALRNTRMAPRYAYIAPTYGQAERIAWDMLKQYTKDIPGVGYNEQKLTCTIPRPARGDNIKITLLGAENPDSIRGIYLDGAVLDEFAEMDPRIWGEVLRPALSDRKGWAIFIGTPKGQNHFYDIYQTALKNFGKGWFAAIYRASQTNVIPPEELQALRDEMSDEQYEQELECSFTAAIIGAYWGKQVNELEKNGKIGKVPHDPALLVDTFWDLGVGDTTTIWFVQQHRMEVRLIDYYEMAGEGISHYSKILHEQHRRYYNYREHNWPHDGDSRDFSTGEERSMTARRLKIRPLTVHRKYDVADGIDAGRRLLPKCYIDAAKCERGIEALKNYQKKWDAKNKIWLNTPLHNWASHGADGFRLMAMALKPGEDRRAERSNLPRTSDNKYDIWAGG